MTGTYPLPEAQLDRFLFKLKVEFPSAPNLTEILMRTTTTWEPTVSHVTDGESLMQIQRVARDLLIASHIMDYAARLVMATHPKLPAHRSRCGSTCATAPRRARHRDWCLRRR